MTFIAPDVPPVNAPHIADERTMLYGWLEEHRAVLLRKCAGLTAEQLRLRSVEPSALSLLGLVRHMAEVERWWFRTMIAGEPDSNVFCTDERPDADFDDVDNADAEADLVTFAEEVRQADAVAAKYDLDHTFEHPRRGTVSTRWVYVHMIEEYARHNGHADILRERIDGATG